MVIDVHNNKHYYNFTPIIDKSDQRWREIHLNVYMYNIDVYLNNDVYAHC